MRRHTEPLFTATKARQKANCKHNIIFFSNHKSVQSRKNQHSQNLKTAKNNDKQQCLCLCASPSSPKSFVMRNPRLRRKQQQTQQGMSQEQKKMVCGIFDRFCSLSNSQEYLSKDPFVSDLFISSIQNTTQLSTIDVIISFIQKCVKIAPPNNPLRTFLSHLLGCLTFGPFWNSSPPPPPQNSSSKPWFDSSFTNSSSSPCSISRFTSASDSEIDRHLVSPHISKCWSSWISFEMFFSAYAQTQMVVGALFHLTERQCETFTLWFREAVWRTTTQTSCGVVRVSQNEILYEQCVVSEEHFVEEDL